VTFRLPQAHIDEMVAHAREDAPNECCGIIAGKGDRAQKLFRAKNAEESKWRYSVDSQDLFRIWRECDQNDWEFLAVYHSHTASEAYPSETDVRLAFWPEAYYVLVSLEDAENPVVRAFRILDGKVSEEELLAE
jgi:proteasome lid subunit RPN8/RPN11